MVATVTPTPTAMKSNPIIANTTALFLANVEPTDEILWQCGHRARCAVFRKINISLQCPQLTRTLISWARLGLAMITCEVLGTVDPTVMMRLQSVLGQDIRVEVTLHVSNALHGHLMYFLPSGGGLMGVASWQFEHLITLWFSLPRMGINCWHTRQTIVGSVLYTAEGV